MKPISLFALLLAVICLNISCQKTESVSAPGITLKKTPSDSFIVTVNNGYGSGKYKAGDTVHIWSIEYTDSQVFNTWSGNTSLLYTPSDWHTWFIMPSYNVTFTGSIKNITPITLNYEQIRGKNVLKPVYSYFPPNHIGDVFLFHGEGGNASGFVSNFEDWQMIKDLISQGFGVIITESEESTLGDLNGDGKIKWQVSPADSINNVDYANIRIITDTFYNRGITNRSIPRYSIGMSNGGDFSSYISGLYSYKTGVAYCSSSSPSFLHTSVTPLQFCMQRWDNNPAAGQQGNAEALSNSGILSSRGICSKYYINQPSPVYPQRFARRSDISDATSISLQNEMKTKGFLNSKNYFIGYAPAYDSAYTKNPSSFPVLNSLNASQKQFVLYELNCCITDHQFYCDYDAETIQFLISQCN